MIATEFTVVNAHCGSSTCNCGENCACKPGECKC
ncbi:hypothetical protein MPER_09911 [Moniliophthora perniciosa FA553]|nr:hypothetical protein MPER_09911 [Moniliophthora perniciosa FA553]